MNDWFPDDLRLTIAYIALGIARFENQRWVRERNAGVTGASVTAGMLVDITAIVGSWGGLAFLAHHAFAVSWLETLGLVVAGQFGGLVYTLFLSSGDSFWRWAVGTLLTWPLLAVVLTFEFLN